MLTKFTGKRIGSLYRGRTGNRRPCNLTSRLLSSFQMIALIDYGSGNLRSVHKALLKVGAQVRIAKHPEEMSGASAVVLPGVGAFDDCLNALEKQRLLEASRAFIKSGRPFLGICVGYQALFEKSEEFNSCAAGMGTFQGKVVRFSEK